MKKLIIYIFLLMFSGCAWGQILSDPGINDTRENIQTENTQIKIFRANDPYDMGRSFERWLRLSDLVDYWDEYKEWTKVNPIKYATGTWTCVLDSMSNGRIIGRNYPDSCTMQRPISAEDFIENFLRGKLREAKP